VATVPPRPARNTPASAYTHFIRSQLYRQAGKTRQATQELKGALTFDPGSPYLLVALGELRFDQDRVNLALERLREALEIDPSFAPAYLLRGRIHRLGRNYPLAVEAFSQAIEAASSDPAGYLALGQLHEAYDRVTEATRIYERMASRIPASAEARFLLGGLALDREEYEVAERHYRFALAADPLFTAARLRLAAVLERLDRTGEAIAEYTAAHDEAPTDEEVVYSLVRLHLREGQPRPADHYIDVLMRGFAGDTVTLSRIGETCFKARDYGRAANAFSKALEVDPGLDGARVWLGASRYADGDPEQALRDLSAVPVTSDWFDDGRRVVARIFADSGQLDDAALIYESLLPARKRDPGLYEALAEIRARQGDFDAAYAVLRAGLREMPGEPHLLLSTARLRSQSGDWEGAVAGVEKLLRANTNDFGALIFLAMAFADRNTRLEEAERYAGRALNLRVNSGEVADALGWIHFRRERFDEALSTLLEAKRLAPDSPEIADHLAEVLETMGRPQESERERRRAVDLRQGEGAAVTDLPDLE
jgi:tetratricopeptide (TPR) repeat protein